MKEIKSFREYILEKSLLGEDSNENLSADEGKETSNDTSTSDSGGDDNQLVNTPVGLDVVTNFTLKFSSGKPDDIRKQLSAKLEQLKKTFDSLDDIITAKQLNNVNNIQDKKQKAAINIFGGSETFTTVRDAWLSEWNKMIKSRRDNKQKVNDIETIRKKAFTQGQRDKADEAYQRLTKEDLDEDVLNEGPINIIKAFGDWANRKLSTGSQLSTGQNRFSSSSVLTTAKERSKGGIYDAGEDSSKSSFANKMYSNFVADARAIIAKDKKLGLSYLTAADKKLKRYNNPNYFIKGTDSAFAEEISRDLYRANSTLESIGYRLRQLLTSYKDSLNKLSKEIEISDAKNQEALASTNTKKAKDRYELNQVKADENEKKRIALKDAFKNKFINPISSKMNEKKLSKEEVKGKYDIVKNYAWEDFDKYTPKQDDEKYSVANLIAKGDEIAPDFGEDRPTKKNNWRADTQEDKSNFDLQKQARALAFYVLAMHQPELVDNCNDAVNFDGFKKRKFSSWLRKAYNEVGRVNPITVIERAKKQLSVWKKLADNKKKNNESGSSDSSKVKNTAAKDFKDSEPAAPANIYDYALQKAKRN
jgi:hypothetical protein